MQLMYNKYCPNADYNNKYKVEYDLNQMDFKRMHSQKDHKNATKVLKSANQKNLRFHTY